MNIVFVLAVLSLIVFTVFSFIKEQKMSRTVRFASGVLAIVLGAAGGIISPYLLSLSVGIGFVTAVSGWMRFMSPKFKSDTAKKFALYMSKAVLAVLLLEVMVFNINSYHLWHSGYEKADLSLDTATVVGMAKSGDGYVSTGDTASVEFVGIDKKIGTIKLDLKSTGYKADYSIDFADETNASYYMRSGLVKGSVFNDIDATKYVVCDFSGKVSKLKINFSGLTDNKITVSSVSINEDYPSHFSYIRFLLICLSVAFVWWFKRTLSANEAIGDRQNRVRAVTALIIAAALILSFVLSSVNLGLDGATGNQITQELVDAFESGQVELKDTPPSDLLSMDNPYDWSARAEQNVNAKWDHLLFNGKYYSYYGIGPVILLYLPYHLLTGMYLSSIMGVLLFNSIAIVFLGMLFYELMKRLFPDIPLSMYTAALLMIFASCGVWYCTVFAQFYEIAQSSGFCFTVLGAYFLIKSNVIGSNGKPLHLLSAALSSLFFSIAVTCRPTTAVWCVVAVAFIISAVIRLWKNGGKKQIAKYLVCALLPFVIIGSGQMIYNYVRFGSFTDFGIAYSLTINDFTHTEFHTQLSAIGFFDYLFAPPSFSGEFPYVQTTLSTLGVNGYYFVATNNGAGLLWRALPMFFLFASPFALKYVDEKKRIRTAVLFSLVAFVAPFTVIASIWESGYGVRYMMDFAFEMLICAFFVMFLFYRKLKSEEAKRIYRHILLISMFMCLFVNMALVYSYYYPGSYVSGYEAVFESFGRMFSIFNT